MVYTGIGKNDTFCCQRGLCHSGDGKLGLLGLAWKAAHTTSWLGPLHGRAKSTWVGLSVSVMLQILLLPFMSSLLVWPSVVAAVATKTLVDLLSCVSQQEKTHLLHDPIVQQNYGICWQGNGHKP